MPETGWARERPQRWPEDRVHVPPRRQRRSGPEREPMRCVRHHRAIFLSDTHLGTRGCKAHLLADFLARNSCETLYLIGDIVDGWRLRRRWHWPPSHDRVVDEVLRKIDRGTRVVYVPGNHDEMLRSYCGRIIAGIEVEAEAVHETADGKRLLIVHGDRFDTVIACAKWLAHLGDSAYTLALHLNEVCHLVRRAMGLPYWSLSAWLKHKVKNAVEYMSCFETVVARDAKKRGFDGVVCGHIHHPALRSIEGVLYINDGDWVESCTALTEDMRGALAIIRWTGMLAGHGSTRRASDSSQLARCAPA